MNEYYAPIRVDQGDAALSPRLDNILLDSLASNHESLKALEITWSQHGCNRRCQIEPVDLELSDTASQVCQPVVVPWHTDAAALHEGKR